jgi:hypothetical protein
LIFDSLATGTHARVAATLRDYLTCEYKAKMGEEEAGGWEFNADNMKAQCPRVPQQPNFSDCGLYVLQYAESLFQRPLRDFSLPLTDMRGWFSKREMRDKRQKIADIIRGLHDKQNKGKPVAFPNLVFTSDFTGYSSGEEADDEDDKEGSIPAASGGVNQALPPQISSTTSDSSPTAVTSSTSTPSASSTNDVESAANKTIEGSPTEPSDSAGEPSTKTVKSGATTPTDDDMEPPQKMIIPSILKRTNATSVNTTTVTPAGSLLIVKKGKMVNVLNDKGKVLVQGSASAMQDPTVGSVATPSATEEPQVKRARLDGSENQPNEKTSTSS